MRGISGHFADREDGGLAGVLVSAYLRLSESEWIVFCGGHTPRIRLSPLLQSAAANGPSALPLCSGTTRTSVNDSSRSTPPPPM